MPELHHFMGAAGFPDRLDWGALNKAGLDDVDRGPHERNERLQRRNLLIRPFTASASPLASLEGGCCCLVSDRPTTACNPSHEAQVIAGRLKVVGIALGFQRRTVSPGSSSQRLGAISRLDVVPDLQPHQSGPRHLGQPCVLPRQQPCPDRPGAGRTHHSPTGHAMAGVSSAQRCPTSRRIRPQHGLTCLPVPAARWPYWP